MLAAMKATATIMIWLLPFLVMQSPLAMAKGQVAMNLPPEDYSLYDRIIEDKFLTSQMQLVLLERMTVSRLVPDREDSMTMAFFQEHDFFEGMLPQELVEDFVGANQSPTRLEARFQFGVRYRFVSERTMEDAEAVAATPVLRDRARPVQSRVVLDRLRFHVRGGRSGTIKRLSMWRICALMGPGQGFWYGADDRDGSGSSSIQKSSGPWESERGPKVTRLRLQSLGL